MVALPGRRCRAARGVARSPEPALPPRVLRRSVQATAAGGRGRGGAARVCGAGVCQARAALQGAVGQRAVPIMHPSVITHQSCGILGGQALPCLAGAAAISAALHSCWACPGATAHPALRIHHGSGSVCDVQQSFSCCWQADAGRSTRQLDMGVGWALGGVHLDRARSGVGGLRGTPVAVAMQMSLLSVRHAQQWAKESATPGFALCSLILDSSHTHQTQWL